MSPRNHLTLVGPHLANPNPAVEDFTAKEDRIVDGFLTEKTVPASRGELFQVRDELKADFRRLDFRLDSLDAKIDSVDKKVDQVDKKIDQLDKKIDQMGKKFDQVDKRLDEVDKRFDEVNKKFVWLRDEFKAEFEKLYSMIARIELLAEHQRNENKVVLDGLNGLYQRQDRVEQKVDSYDKILAHLARSRKDI